MKRRNSIRDLLGITAWIAIFSSPAIAALLGAPSGIVVGLAVALVIANTAVMFSAR
jgi:hypothetical protein